MIKRRSLLDKRTQPHRCQPGRHHPFAIAPQCFCGRWLTRAAAAGATVRRDVV
jgi:hypothetical protein